MNEFTTIAPPQRVNTSTVPQRPSKAHQWNTDVQEWILPSDNADIPLVGMCRGSEHRQGVTLPWDKFSVVTSGSKKRLHYVCKACDAARQREWYRKKHPNAATRIDIPPSATNAELDALRSAVEAATQEQPMQGMQAFAQAAIEAMPQFVHINTPLQIAPGARMAGDIDTVRDLVVAPQTISEQLVAIARQVESQYGREADLTQQLDLALENVATLQEEKLAAQQLLDDASATIEKLLRDMATLSTEQTIVVDSYKTDIGEMEKMFTKVREYYSSLARIGIQVPAEFQI